MIRALTDKIIKFLQRQGAVPADGDEMAEVYRYGVEITISSICNILLILIAGIILRDLWCSAIYLVVMIAVRQYTGGYHAPTYLKCNTVFTVTFILVYFLSSAAARFVPAYIIAALLILNLPVVYLLSPVPNIHKPLDRKQKGKFRIVAVVLYFLGGTASAGIWLKFRFHGVFTAFTLFAIVVLMILEIILQKKGIHERIEEE